MENCKTCVVTFQYRFFTPYEIVEGGFETTCIRKFTISSQKMDIVRNLSECCGAVYNPEKNIFEFSSKEGYESMIEYLIFYITL